MSDFMYGSLCISDIPRELFKKAGNGKVYLNIAVARRKEVGQYGDTHNVIASVPKELSKDDEKPIYCGSLKEYVPNPAVSTADVESAPSASDDDLPF